MLAKPSPNWNASTAVCRLMPTRSASGAMIGMVTNAWPLPDGMKKLITSCTSIMPTAPRCAPSSDSGVASTSTIVCSTTPSSRISAIARANPMSSAVIASSAAPAPKLRAVPFTPSPPTSPVNSARPMNSAPSSTRYQPRVEIPQIISASEASAATSSTMRRPSSCGYSLGGACSGSMPFLRLASGSACTFFA